MFTSLYQSSMVFTSQNFGAKKFERIKKTFEICLMYNLGIWVLQAILTFFCGEWLIGIYAKDDLTVMDFGWRKLGLLGYTYGLLGLMNILSGSLRGMGASLMNMIMSIAGVCGIRIIWILTAFRAIGTWEALFLCYPLSWAGTTLLYFAMFVYIFKKEKAKCLKI